MQLNNDGDVMYKIRKNMLKVLFKNYESFAKKSNNAQIRTTYYNDIPTFEEDTDGTVAATTIRRKSNNEVTNVQQRNDNLASNKMTVTLTSAGKIEGHTERVVLSRGDGVSFGVCIVGGKVNITSDSQVSGIFVKHIIPSSAADLSRKIKIGDRILTVNGQDVRGSTQEEAILLMRQSGNEICFDVQRFDEFARQEEIELNERLNDKGPPPNPPNEISPKSSQLPISSKESTNKPENNHKTPSSEEDDDDEDDEESGGKVVTKMGYEIDRKSAGNIKRSKEEMANDPEPEDEYGYTMLKLKRKYGTFGNVVRTKIPRDENNSIGIALAGHQNRHQMGVLVAGINPKGNAKDSDIQIGDEILEVNGTVLHKMCHLNASTIIKTIGGSVMVVILVRKESAIDNLAVKPVVSFPAVFDQFDQLYACFKNVRRINIQKVGVSLGIMIIEGKHAELGQGIFISDIQENSNAERAGLTIGEMILAVNKDLLIDCNYESAASLLKRAEGIVSLTVCNPNKKEGMDGAIAEASDVKPIDKIEAAPKPEPPPPKVELPPSEASIEPNKETIIEINCDNKSLGIDVKGGAGTHMEVGAAIMNLIPAFPAVKDNRLQLFDIILEVEGKKITQDTSELDVRRLLKVKYQKVKLLVHRSEPPKFNEIDVEINRKPGKDFGIIYTDIKDCGIIVKEIISGCLIDVDKRIIVGDIISKINSDDLKNLPLPNVMLLFKITQGKITLKVLRPKM